MTTPNEELINNLTIKAGVMEMGEKIAWGSDTALMRQAAATLQSQAERMAVLERESEMRRIALHEAMLEADTLRAAPVAIVDTRDALGLCAPAEEDFTALYALQGRRVALVDLGPNAKLSGAEGVRS